MTRALKTFFNKVIQVLDHKILAVAKVFVLLGSKLTTNKKRKFLS